MGERKNTAEARTPSPADAREEQGLGIDLTLLSVKSSCFVRLVGESGSNDLDNGRQSALRSLGEGPIGEIARASLRLGARHTREGPERRMPEEGGNTKNELGSLRSEDQSPGSGVGPHILAEKLGRDKCYDNKGLSTGSWLPTSSKVSLNVIFEHFGISGDVVENKRSCR